MRPEPHQHPLPHPNHQTTNMTNQRQEPFGRPTKLTPDTATLIITAVRAGNYIETAAALAGIDPSTIWRWLRESEQDDADQAKVDFRLALTRAKAEAEVRTVGAVQKGIQGGALLKRTTRPGRNGPETEEQWAPPDPRAGLAFLKAAYPSRWRDGVHAVEISGPGGGPVLVAGDSAEARLAARIAAVVEADRLELEASGVMDAVVVEDE